MPVGIPVDVGSYLAPPAPSRGAYFNVVFDLDGPRTEPQQPSRERAAMASAVSAARSRQRNRRSRASLRSGA